MLKSQWLYHCQLKKFLLFSLVRTFTCYCSVRTQIQTAMHQVTDIAVFSSAETHRTMMHSVEVKKTSVQKLKKDLEQMERETETKLAEIDSQNSQLAVSMIKCCHGNIVLA